MAVQGKTVTLTRWHVVGRDWQFPRSLTVHKLCPLAVATQGIRLMQPTLLNFINGQSFTAASGRTFDRLSPADGSLVRRVSGPAKLRSGGGCRRKAALHGSWGQMDIAAWANLLHKLADALDRDTDRLLRAEIADTGKPVALAQGLDIPRGAANFRVFIDMVKAAHEASYRTSTPDGRGALTTRCVVRKGWSQSSARGTCRS